MACVWLIAQGDFCARVFPEQTFENWLAVRILPSYPNAVNSRLKIFRVETPRQSALPLPETFRSA